MQITECEIANWHEFVILIIAQIYESHNIKMIRYPNISSEFYEKYNIEFFEISINFECKQPRTSVILNLHAFCYVDYNTMREISFLQIRIDI